MVSVPIDWTVIEDALYTWFATSMGISVDWADLNDAHSDYPYGTLKIIAGPTELSTTDAVIRTKDATRAFDTNVIPTAEDSATYTITINGTAFDFVSGTSATVAEITAGLATVIDAGSEPVTVTDNGTSLDVATSVSGDTFTIVLTSNMSRTLNDDGGAEIELDISGLREITVSCQTFVRPPSAADPSAHARNHLSAAQAALQLPTFRQALFDAGISVIQRGAISDLSGLIGDAMESRANMDIRFYILSSVKEYVGFVESVTGTGTITDVDDDISITLDSSEGA